ncbi:unnamed protein product [Alternaria alternata]
MNNFPTLGNQDGFVQAAEDQYQARPDTPDTNTWWSHNAMNQKFEGEQQWTGFPASTSQTLSFGEAYGYGPELAASSQPTVSLTRDDHSDSPFENTQSPGGTDEDTAMEDRNSCSPSAAGDQVVITLPTLQAGNFPGNAEIIRAICEKLGIIADRVMSLQILALLNNYEALKQLSFENAVAELAKSFSEALQAVLRAEGTIPSANDVPPSNLHSEGRATQPGRVEKNKRLKGRGCPGDGGACRFRNKRWTSRAKFLAHFMEHEQEYENPNGQGGYDNYKCLSCEARNRRTNRNDNVVTKPCFREFGKHVFDEHHKD